jgi:DNA-binding SARP family transcriptional activator
MSAARVRGLLLLHRGRVVTVDRLVDELWDNNPPDSALAALAALRVHVSRLRKTLAAAGLENLLVTKPTGYLLDITEGCAVRRLLDEELGLEPSAEVAQLHQSILTQTVPR